MGSLCLDVSGRRQSTCLQNVGVIAQDVLKAFPELVAETPVNFKGNTGNYFTVDYAGLTAPLITGVNTLNDRTERLALEVQKLKAENADQAAQLAQLRTEVTRLARKVSVQTAAR